MNVDTESNVRGESKAKYTALAHAVRFAMRCGITAPADLASELQCTPSAVYRAMKQLEAVDRTVTESDRAVKSDRTELTVQSQTDHTVTKSDASVTPARVLDNNLLTKLVETSVSKKPPTPSKTKSGPTKLDALRAFEAYNTTALACALPQASRLTPDRERKIIARLKDFGADGWTRALANIEKSSFLTGKNDRGFRADLDFLLQAKSFARVHDGGYGNGRHAELKITIPKRESDAETTRRHEQWLQENGCMPS